MKIIEEIIHIKNILIKKKCDPRDDNINFIGADVWDATAIWKQWLMSCCVCFVLF